LTVLDASALMAILLGEPAAADCREAVGVDDEFLMSATNLTESLVAAARRQLHGEMARLIDALAPVIVPVTEARAYAAVRAYLRWGKGFHEAKLNFGDCFAYALAKEHECPLLFVGNDFAQTDVQSALS
jgi:ribonuclease VapC